MARSRLPRPSLDQRPVSVPLPGHRVSWVARAVVRLPLHRTRAVRFYPLSAAWLRAAVVRQRRSRESRTRVLSSCQWKGECNAVWSGTWQAPDLASP